MSFYKYFSEHDRVVSSRPLYQLTTLEPGNNSGWKTDSDDPKNFVMFGVGGTNYQSSKPVFDMTYGLYTSSLADATDQQKAQYHIYNQFTKMLLGHDINNNIKQFNSTEGITLSPTPDQNYLPFCYVINLARSQMNDRINHKTFELKIKLTNNTEISIKDDNSIINAGADGFHYGTLSAVQDNNTLATTQATDSVGYIFYEAGVVVLSPFIFAKNNNGITNLLTNKTENICGILANDSSFKDDLDTLYDNSAKGIEDYINFIKDKITKISYNSVTELNSTIYFCRAYNHEFNYSSNPTYISDGEIIVKAGDPEEPSRTYITTVGLYSDDNQLLAVAKLSEPILKTRDNELIARVRLDW